MIELVVVYCLTLNPTQCRELPVVPDDGRPIVSVAECLRGGAIGGATFMLEHAEWTVKGIRCRERKPTDFEIWLSQRRQRAP